MLDTLWVAALVFCAFLAGALGAAVVLWLKTKKKKKQIAEPQGSHIARRVQREKPLSGWQNAARNEQMYNSR